MKAESCKGGSRIAIMMYLMNDPENFGMMHDYVKPIVIGFMQ